jgi:hypothetical protein
MPLVRVDATMGTICAPAGFLILYELDISRYRSTYRSLLNNNVLDDEIFNINVFGIGI